MIKECLSLGKRIRGELRISHEVIASIAIRATCETEGIAGMAQRPIKLKNLAPMLSKTERSVSIELYEDVAVIGVYVELCYGANIPTVCAKVQSAVKEAVQSMCSIAVSKVNVYVMGIAFEDKK